MPVDPSDPSYRIPRPAPPPAVAIPAHAVPVNAPHVPANAIPVQAPPMMPPFFHGNHPNFEAILMPLHAHLQQIVLNPQQMLQEINQILPPRTPFQRFLNFVSQRFLRFCIPIINAYNRITDFMTRFFNR